MKIRLLSLTRLRSALALLLLVGCGAKVPEGSLVVPRGSTISVTVSEGISAAGAADGIPFRAQLESPLANEAAVFAPAGTPLEGIVEASGTGEGKTEVVLRLTRLQLSETSQVDIETIPMSRSSSSVVVSNTVIEPTIGLEDRIRYLAELGDGGGSSENPGSSIGAIVSRNTQLVFTLSKDLVVPPTS